MLSAVLVTVICVFLSEDVSINNEHNVYLDKSDNHHNTMLGSEHKQANKHGSAIIKSKALTRIKTKMKDTVNLGSELKSTKDA